MLGRAGGDGGELGHVLATTAVGVVLDVKTAAGARARIDEARARADQDLLSRAARPAASARGSDRVAGVERRQALAPQVGRERSAMPSTLGRRTTP